MLNTRMGKHFLLFGVLVMSATSTSAALAQAVVFLECTYLAGVLNGSRLIQKRKRPTT